MKPYAEVYLDDVVETQGKLFEYVAETFPQADFQNFVETYMKSKTRRFIDDGQPYVNTMDPVTLWEYFQKADGYKVKKGKSLLDLSLNGWENFTRCFNGKTNCPVKKPFVKFPLIF